MKYGVIPTNFAERVALLTGNVPVPVIDTLIALVKARTIMAGVRLGVFDALRDRARTARDLAEALHLDAECVELLLRTLVVFDYITRTGTAYALSPLSRRTLVRGSGMELSGYVEWNYTQWDLIAGLEDMIRTGRGIDFHTTMADVDAWRHYQRAMLEIARLDAPVIAARVPVLKGAARLLDLAGSHGVIGAAICRRHPPMRSTVIDLPAAIAHCRSLAEAERITDVVDHREGDIMTSDLGPAADVVLLSNILHHFTPERIAVLLARARAALNPGGTVAVWEFEAPEASATPGAGDAVALFFRLTSTARAYHAKEYAAWLRTAGFESIKIRRPIRRPGSLLVTARA